MGDSDAKTVADRPRSGPGADPTEPTAAPAIEPGVLPARYVAKDEIGRGGMGRVVEANDEVLGRTVAVKQALTLDTDALRRFERETRITARLEHPSIVPVYDAGRSPDGTPYYVMRKVTGQRLDKMITGEDSLDVRLALLPNVLAATQAIAHAHARGVVHRDLKPSNILIGDLGETIVIDWGLAKVVGEDDGDAAITRIDAGGSLRTRVGTVVGTPGFMSPEQVRGDAIDARSDVFALGATLYYLLSRRYPHQAASEDEVMVATADRPVPSIESVVRGVPAELATITDKALAFEHADRYTDAAQLAEDLRRFLAGQLVASHRYSTWERVRRFVRRNRIVLATVTLALVALVIGGVIAVRNVIAARDEAVVQRNEAELMRAREADRANQVTLAQARLLLDTNPTAAVALAKPLASSKYWREVRAIGADARGAGIATKLPGAWLQTVAFMADGVHAVAMTDNGDVWFYNVATVTGRKIATASNVNRIVGLDDRHALALSSKTPDATWIDTATGETAVLAIDTSFKTVHPSGDLTYLTDAVGRAWTLANTTHVLTRYETPERVWEVLPSPDGKILALAGVTGVWLAEGGPPTRRIKDQEAHSLAWAEDGSRLTALVQDTVYELVIATKQLTSWKVTQAVTDIALHQGVHYAGGITGLLVNGRTPAGWVPDAFVLGLQGTSGEAMVDASDDRIAVFRESQRIDIIPPLTPLFAFAATPRSRYLLAVCRGFLLRWDIESVTGTSYDASTDTAVAHAPVNDHLLMLAHGGAPIDWLDFTTGTRTPGPTLPLSLGVTDSPGGDRMFVFDSWHGDGWLLRPGTTEVVPFQTGVALAAHIDPLHLVTGSTDGVLRLVDVPSGTARELFRHGDQPLGMLRAPWRTSTWVAAGFADGLLWRMQVATGAIEQWMRTGHAWRRGESMISADGSLWFGDDTKLMRWPPGGTVVTVATTTEPIDAIIEVDATRFMVHTAVGDVFLVDSTRPELVPTVSMETRSSSRAPLASMVGITKAGIGVIVVDGIANTSFRAARLLTNNDSVSLTLDAHYAYANPDARWVAWDISVPQSPEETARWLDTLTNAVAGKGAAVTW